MLSLTTLFLGYSELYSQLDPDFWTSTFISALSNFNKNLLSQFSQKPSSSISNYPQYLIGFFNLSHFPLNPQVMSDYPGLSSVRALFSWFSQNPPFPLMLPLSDL